MVEHPPGALLDVADLQVEFKTRNGIAQVLDGIIVKAVPSAYSGARKNRDRVQLEGDPPSPIDLPAGCRFAGRCPFAERRCHAEPPPIGKFSDDHLAACHLIDEAGVPPHEKL